MNTVLDKLFVTPMAWLLAVPIVLLDRLLTMSPVEVKNWDDACTAGTKNASYVGCAL
ncbi:hypothetical protein [Rhodococcus rhodochrous]|uniref:hypothetical protein n=1 Tax=Rhodococcus rhodochrous TaxID=1829 RepID=UPI000A5FB7B5|nr:hypothetical protein [Rhodococcus rhodochrous]